jgi:hypothetical protein
MHPYGLEPVARSLLIPHTCGARFLLSTLQRQSRWRAASLATVGACGSLVAQAFTPRACRWPRTSTSQRWGHHEQTHLHPTRDCTEASSSTYSRDCPAWLNQVHDWVDGDTRFPISYRSFYPKTLWERKSADSNFSYTFSVLSRGGV